MYSEDEEMDGILLLVRSTILPSITEARALILKGLEFALRFIQPMSRFL